MVNGMGLAGVHVALATPVHHSGELDFRGMGALLERIHRNGKVSAICCTGSTGEGPRLTRSQRLAALRLVRDQTTPVTPVIPAPSAGPPREVLDEIDELAAAGATLALLAAP